MRFPAPRGRSLSRTIWNALFCRGFAAAPSQPRRRLARLGSGLVLLAAVCALALGKAAIVVDELRRTTRYEGPLEGAAAALRHVPDDPLSDGGLLAEPAAGPSDQDRTREGGGAPATLDAVASTGDRPVAARLDPATLDPHELEALGELLARRTALEEREQELDLRAALLEDAEAKLVARLSELEALKTTIEMMLERHEAAEDARLAGLVKIYETMKPKAAAEVFNRLEMPVLLEVVSRMREGTASEIIARMTPERAEQLTAELARRRGIPDALTSSGDS